MKIIHVGNTQKNNSHGRCKRYVNVNLVAYIHNKEDLEKIEMREK